MPVPACAGEEALLQWVKKDKVMRTKPEDTTRLAGEIRATERKLEDLEQEIGEIGEPASSTLLNRLEALKIEERALRRNYAETQTRAPDKGKMEKVEALLHHIEMEETSLEHEADFLHQASPTTLEFAYRGGTRLFDPVARGWKKALGDRHLLWHSPFVNNTFTTLSSRFEMPPPQGK
jgi:hypothetical protein